jgi:hypothetical protein
MATVRPALPRMKKFGATETVAPMGVIHMSVQREGY